MTFKDVLLTFPCFYSKSTIKLAATLSLIYLFLLPHSAFSSVQPQCSVSIVNQWWSGSQVSVKVKNPGSQPMTDWHVELTYINGGSVSNSWSSTQTGSNPALFSAPPWKTSLGANEQFEFGFVAVHNAGPQTPAITGCYHGSPMVADTDSDGIADDLDQCPNTPNGEAVNANGCAPSQLDSDSDGINDALDTCPNTPANELANASGCAPSQLDSDNDGVNDALDACPNTPVNETANASGCSLSQLDSDNDGVNDSIDACPSTMTGSSVNATGCALYQLDSDNDGAHDGIDACPNTPANETANASGCAPSQLDSDNDGINDALDTCPSTIAGSSVNASGCAPYQLDSDNDGAHDGIDACPNTPANETANASGCSPSQLDSDNDGVNDALDACPYTPANEVANASGCAPSQLDSDNDGAHDGIDACPNTPVNETANASGCAPSQLDSDSDGINDALDTCPNTPANETANASGCAPSQLDSDNDGITDALDTCPSTMTGSSVNASGCATYQLDSDNDGAHDGIDACPNTPANEIANASGCSLSQLDSDNDGAHDGVDACPNTPANETANASGCSLSQLDSDSDGINDALDICPNTPVNETANANGCSPSQLDSDNDGVNDALDTCPSTIAGSSVNASGCAPYQLDSDNDGAHDGIDACPNTPASETANASGCAPSQLDSDSDGINDALDICPNTPVNETANVSGCALSQLDSDNDGINDALDTCPSTIAGSSVNASGCALYQLDSDNDGAHDGIDACPNTTAGSSVDTNGCALYQLDQEPPTIETVVPAPGAENIAVDSLIVLNFSEPVLPSSINLLLNGEPFAYSLSANGNSITIIPDNAFTYANVYLLTLSSSAVDQAGNSLTGDFNWIFETSDQPAAESMQEHKILGSGTGGTSFFGLAVDVSDNFAIVGAYQDNDQKGTAFIYQRIGNEWLEQQILSPAELLKSDFFGYAVAINGNRAAVSAYGDDEFGPNSGVVYVFEYNGDLWVQTAVLHASDAQDGDIFGRSVAIDQDTIIIGATGDDDKGLSSGSVYVYELTNGLWSETESAKLTAEDGSGSDYFGTSVSISNNQIIVGAPNDDDFGTNSGSAYIFTKSTEGWQQLKLTTSDENSLDYFGFSVAISGDTAVVGAYGNDDLGTSSGAIYIFEKSETGGWHYQKLHASDGNSVDYFGQSVDISGNKVIAGAYGTDGSAPTTGSAYIFIKSAQEWQELAPKLTASDASTSDYYGRKVAISDNVALVGAYGDDDFGDFTGSAYIYDNIEATPFSLTSVTPVPDITNVIDSTIIGATFSHALDPASIDSYSLTLSGNLGQVDGTIDVVDNKIYFQPTNNLNYGETYTAVINGSIKDSNGEKLLTSFTWSFTISPSDDYIPPYITGLQTQNGPDGASINTTINVSFSEALAPETVNNANITLVRNGVNLPGEITYDGSNLVIFTPFAPLDYATAHEFLINTEIKDISGNHLMNSYRHIIDTESEPDTTRPTVVSTTPDSFSEDVSVDSAITVAFSELMNRSSINTNTITVFDGQYFKEGTVSYINSTATFTPAGPLAAGTTYTVTVSGSVMDLAGNSMAMPFTWEFNTLPPPDFEPPFVVSVSPGDNSYDIALNAPITVVFSEPIDCTTVNISSFFIYDISYPIPGNYDCSDNQVTFTPSENYLYETNYGVFVNLNIKDLAGNSLELFNSRFSTIPATTWNQIVGQGEGKWVFADDAQGYKILSEDRRSDYFDLLGTQINANGEYLNTVLSVLSPSQSNSAALMADGSIVTVGRTRLNRGIAEDVFVSKYDRYGYSLWDKTFSTENDDGAHSVKITNDGGVIVAGFNNNTFGFSDVKGWLIKLDADGNEQWNKSYDSSTGVVIFYDAIQTSDGGYIAVGDNDNGAFLVKTNSLGTTLWTKVFDFGTNPERGLFVREASDGYIIAGDSAVANSGLNGYQGWLFKVNFNGTLLWQNFYGGSGSDTISWIELTENDNIVIAQTEPNSSALLMLDSYGSLMWFNSYGGTINHFQQTEDGGFIITGKAATGGAQVIKTNVVGDSQYLP